MVYIVIHVQDYRDENAFAICETLDGFKRAVSQHSRFFYQGAPWSVQFDETKVTQENENSFKYVIDEEEFFLAIAAENYG